MGEVLGTSKGSKRSLEISCWYSHCPIHTQSALGQSPACKAGLVRSGSTSGFRLETFGCRWCIPSFAFAGSKSPGILMVLKNGCSKVASSFSVGRSLDQLNSQHVKLSFTFSFGPRLSEAPSAKTSMFQSGPCAVKLHRASNSQKCEASGSDHTSRYYRGLLTTNTTLEVSYHYIVCYTALLRALHYNMRP